jgi:hypothetical protein
MEIPEGTDIHSALYYESRAFEVDGIKYYPDLGMQQVTVNYMFEERWDSVGGKAAAEMPCSREVDMDHWMSYGNGHGIRGAVNLVPLPPSNWRLQCKCDDCKRRPRESAIDIKAEWELELMEGTD